ncbi:MAG: hypothetical protein HYZ48_05245 [Chlamydiales bacterium]|nr:hypothetical protein [Chlamydiales bacterium]
MRNRLNKWASSLLVLASGVVAQGFADQAEMERDNPLIAGTGFLGAQTNKAAPVLSSADSSSSEQNVFGDWQGASGRASVEKGFTLSAAFLYLQATTDNLLYAESITLVPPSGSKPGYADAEERQLDFEWAPGVQVNLGYIFPQRQQWEVFLSWNYLHSKAHDSADVAPLNLNGSFIKPYMYSYITGGDAEKASADWKLKFNTLDLTFARQFFVGKYLALKPMLGLRGAFIDQHFHAKYAAFQVGGTLGAPLLFPFDSFFKNHTDFSGGGVRLGADLQWFMSSQWSILGGFSGSLLYGHFKVRQKISGAILITDSILIPTPVKIRDSQNRISPNLEGKFGIQWQTFFNQDRFKVSLGAFYTLIYWFNQNKILNASTSFSFNPIAPHATINPQAGNLQMQGGTFELRFEF